MEEVFVDADALIGLNDRFDAHHKTAIQISQRLEADNTPLITGTNIISEVTTLLSQRLGHAKAVDFLNELRSGTTRIVHPTELVVFEAEEIFRKQRSKNVSYSDCLSFAIMRDRGINLAFSFDQDFTKNGFKLIK